jgi:hypothetical protein
VVNGHTPVMDSADAEWEYAPLRIPSDTDRQTAAVQLTLHAEYGGWELARVRLHADGTRRVWLRRRRSGHRLPGPLS